MVFFDNASTTKINKSVIDEINKINSEFFYNPSSLYSEAVNLNKLIKDKKQSMLKLLGADIFDNLVFTGSATEANNLAIRGTLKKGGKLVVSSGEHPSIYNLAKQLQSEGCEVEFVKLNSDGVVDFNDLRQKLKNATVLSIIHTSNETGSVNDIKQITQMAKTINPKIIVHSDGVQSVGKIAVNILDLGVDLYTISAHKINGPKGIGALYINNKINVKPLIIGGPQESGIRGGTENVSGISAFEIALKEAVSNQLNSTMHMSKLQDTLIKLVKENLPSVKVVEINKNNRSPHVTVLSVSNIKSETVMYLLEEKGFIVGNGSACSSRLTNNRVLDSMGFDIKFIESSIRVSFSADNNEEEVKNFVNALKEVVDNYGKN